MAVTSEKPRAKTARTAARATKPSHAKAPTKALKPGGKGGPSPVRKAKAKAAKSAARAAVSPGSTSGKLARKVALRVITRAGKRIVTSGASAARGATRGATERILEAASTTTSPGSHHRPPIQADIDVAVPVQVAWDQWMALEWVPDSAGAITGLRRGRNGELRGKLRNERWAAEVTEVHEPHSFAWRTKRGSDCVGLITFHPLSDWLTRIELSLDAKPLALGQAAALAGHRADRRTAAELRRFKAQLELISPDDYGEDG
jgi:uncharacterized membrane protein